MKFLFTKRFKAAYKKLTAGIKNKFSKQIELMQSDFLHPSLHTKKIQGASNIWEARIDYQYRFTFNKEGDTIILRNIGNHDDVLKNA